MSVRIVRSIPQTITHALWLLNGTAAAPSLAFSNSTGTGIYLRTPGFLTIAGNGTASVEAADTQLTLASGMSFGWNVGAIGSGLDTILVRDAANTLALKNGSTLQSLRVYAANGGYMERTAVSELTTIAAAASTNTAIQIPAQAVVYGVSVRVTTVIPTAATFTVTGTTSGTTFNTAAVSTAANTTDPGTAACPYKNGAAQTIKITPNLTPADNTGRVRVTVLYYTVTPPTS